MKVIQPKILVGAMGVVGLLLPAILIIGSLLGEPIRPSISAYYYADPPWDSVFVGSLSAMAICLFAYRGFNGTLDDKIAYAACLAVLVTAFVAPREPNCTPADSCSFASATTLCGPCVHLIGAVLFIVILGYFCGRFAVNAKDRDDFWPGLMHWIFLGFMIVGFAVAVYGWFKDRGETTVVFWGETVVVWAFSLSWCIEAIEMHLDGCRKSDDCKKPRERRQDGSKACGGSHGDAGAKRDPSSPSPA